jgi:hypothetical protein
MAAYDRECIMQLQEWLERERLTYPAMPMNGALPNFFTINGKAYPDTDTVELRVGRPHPAPHHQRQRRAGRRRRSHRDHKRVVTAARATAPCR